MKMKLTIYKPCSSYYLTEFHIFIRFNVFKFLLNNIENTVNILSASFPFSLAKNSNLKILIYIYLYHFIV